MEQSLNEALRASYTAGGVALRASLALYHKHMTSCIQSIRHARIIKSDVMGPDRHWLEGGWRGAAGSDSDHTAKVVRSKVSGQVMCVYTCVYIYVYVYMFVCMYMAASQVRA